MRYKLSKLLLRLAEKLDPTSFVWHRFDNVVHLCGVAVEHTDEGPCLAVMPPAHMNCREFLTLLIQEGTGIFEQIRKEGLEVQCYDLALQEEEEEMLELETTKKEVAQC